MFAAFSQRDLQNTKTVLLHGLQQPGVVTVAELLALVEKELPEVGPAGQMAGPGAEELNMTRLCLSCGAGHMVGPYEIGGLALVRCSRKCGYSEVIG